MARIDGRAMPRRSTFLYYSLIIPRTHASCVNSRFARKSLCVALHALQVAGQHD
ncbi:hypothetical protein BGX38DRAFT_1155095, partial [Terfezia claveryi]